MAEVAMAEGTITEETLVDEAMAEVAMAEEIMAEVVTAEVILTEVAIAEDTMIGDPLTESILAEGTRYIGETELFAFNSNSAIRICNSNSFSRASSTTICSLISSNLSDAEAEVVGAHTAGAAETNGTWMNDDEHVGT